LAKEKAQIPSDLVVATAGCAWKPIIIKAKKYLGCAEGVTIYSVNYISGDGTFPQWNTLAKKHAGWNQIVQHIGLIILTNAGVVIFDSC
jgi:hypothetical protein